MTNQRRDFLKKTGLIGAWLTGILVPGAGALETIAHPGKNSNDLLNGLTGEGRKQIFNMSEWSVAHRSSAVDVPYFTCGSRMKNKPVDFSIDHENLTPVKAMAQ